MRSKSVYVGGLAMLVMLQRNVRHLLSERGSAPGRVLSALNPNVTRIDPDLTVRRVASVVGISTGGSSDGNNGALMALDLAMRLDDRPPQSLEELLGRLDPRVLKQHYGSKVPWALDGDDVRVAYRRVKSLEVRTDDADAVYRAVLRMPERRPAQPRGA